MCVVCGKDDSCLRKYIVPHEYRKFFPDVMRDHQSHDVLLMCLNCHQKSNRMDHILRTELAQECGIPLQENNLKFKEDFEIRAIRSSARALIKDKNVNKIPAIRKEELKQVLVDHFKKDIITDDDLETAFNYDPYVDNEDYIPHAEAVVNYFATNDGILKLEKMWRQHFLDRMKPKFLPKNWSVDHQEERLQIRKEENRIDKEDLDAALGTNVENS